MPDSHLPRVSNKENCVSVFPSVEWGQLHYLTPMVIVGDISYMVVGSLKQ